MVSGLAQRVRIMINRSLSLVQGSRSDTMRIAWLKMFACEAVKLRDDGSRFDAGLGDEFTGMECIRR